MFFKEFMRGMDNLHGEDCESYLRALREKGAIEEHLPELAELWSAEGEQDRRYHPEGDTWEHTLLVVRGIRREHSLATRLAAVFHDIGKPWTFRCWPDGGISNRGHAAAGARLFRRSIAVRFEIGNELTESIATVIHYHMLMHRDPLEELDVLIVNEVLRLPVVEDLIELQHMDAFGSGAGIEKRKARSKKRQWTQLLQKV